VKNLLYKVQFILKNEAGVNPALFCLEYQEDLNLDKVAHK